MSKSIEIRNITFQYNQGKIVFSNFKQIFEEAKIYGVVGSNGIGKSTLGKLIMKTLTVNSGDILINEESIHGMTLASIGNKIGYVYQNPTKQLFASTVYEELAFPLTLKGESNVIVDEKVLAQLEKFDLIQFKNYTPLQLSEGEKQRLVVSASLMKEVDFIIFDEPTTALDEKWKEELANSIKTKRDEEGTGFIIISHDMEFLEKLDVTLVEMR